MSYYDISNAVPCLGCGILQSTSVWPAGEKSVPSATLPMPPGLSSTRWLAHGSHSSLPELCIILRCMDQILLNLWDSYPGRFVTFLRTNGVTSALIPSRSQQRDVLSLYHSNNWTAELTSPVARSPSAFPSVPLDLWKNEKKFQEKKLSSALCLISKYSYAVNSEIIGEFQTTFHLNDGLTESNLHAFHFM